MHNTKARIHAGLAVALAAALFPPRVEATDGRVIVRWVKQAMPVVRLENIGTAEAARMYALVTVAMYDAVNGIDSARGRAREHALVPPAGAPANADPRVAAAVAGREVLALLVPARSGLLDAELALYQRPGASAQAGQAWGRSVGTRVVQLRASDGSQTPVVMPARPGPGAHRASFDARWRHMTPFGIASSTRYGSLPPPPLESAGYARAYNEVKILGVADGDPGRDEIARFWFAESGTSRETGLWLQAVIAAAAQRRTIHSLSDTERLLALEGMSIADSVIVSWDVKANHFAWRPTVAIREAATDGNPETAPDPLWTSRMGTTGGSPEYNSGTSTFGGAVSRVLELFYGETALRFCFEAEGATGGARCYASPLEAAREAGFSRILQGIHFRFSDEDGRRLGRAIGEEVAATRLRPVR